MRDALVDIEVGIHDSCPPTGNFEQTDRWTLVLVGSRAILGFSFSRVPFWCYYSGSHMGKAPMSGVPHWKIRSEVRGAGPCQQDQCRSAKTKSVSGATTHSLKLLDDKLFVVRSLEVFANQLKKSAGSQQVAKGRTPS